MAVALGLNQTSSAPPRSGRTVRTAPLFSLMTDDIPVPIGRRCIAAEQDLIIWADGHALRAVAVVDRNREGRLDLHGLGIDHRNRAWPIVAGAVDLWNVLIKFPGLRTPPALLEAVGGVRGALLAVKHERCQALYSVVVEMKVTKGASALCRDFAIMITLFCGS